MSCNPHAVGGATFLQGVGGGLRADDGPAGCLLYIYYAGLKYFLVKIPRGFGRPGAASTRAVQDDLVQNSVAGGGPTNSLMVRERDAGCCTSGNHENVHEVLQRGFASTVRWSALMA